MELIALTFVMSLLAGILSGMSGGGGALILMPYYIFIGMTPAEAVATVKVVGVGVSGGALAAFRGTGLVRRSLLLPLILITIGMAFLGAWLIPKIEAGIFQVVIGVLLIAVTPALFINSKSMQPGTRSRGWVIAGYAVYIGISFLLAMFGAGMALLLTINLMLFFGLSALEATATKRVAQSVQSALMLILLLLQGLVVLGHGIATLIGAFWGSHIGSKIAIKKGDAFVKVAITVAMVASGIALIVSA